MEGRAPEAADPAPAGRLDGPTLAVASASRRPESSTMRCSG